MIDPIKTRAIYTGSLPFILINILMLGILIAFPGLVTHYKAPPVQMNQTDINSQINNAGSSGFGQPGMSLDGGMELQGTPSFGLPGPADGMPALPNFGAPATPPANAPADGATAPAPGGLPGPGDAGGLPRFD
jgi:hypothetical protein